MLSGIRAFEGKFLTLFPSSLHREPGGAVGDKVGAGQTRKRSAALGKEYKSFCEKAGEDAIHGGAGGGKGIESPEKTAISGAMNQSGSREIPDSGKMSPPRKQLASVNVTKKYLDVAFLSIFPGLVDFFGGICSPGEKRSSMTAF